MTVVVITKGSHARSTHLPPLGEPRQFAHRWDADDPEDVAHQALNFTTYAQALGGHTPPFVLLRPNEIPEDEQEREHLEVNLSDWASIVETGTGIPVEIR